jgi:hypothetical protein
MFDFFKKKPKAPALSKQADAAIDVAHGTLQMQITLGCASVDIFERDDYALGYVFGFTDGLLQAMGVADELQCIAALAATYEALFHESLGPKLLRRSLDLQGTDNFAKGVSLGGGEAFAFLRDKTPPFGLSSRFHEKG